MPWGLLGPDPANLEGPANITIITEYCGWRDRTDEKQPRSLDRGCRPALALPSIYFSRAIVSSCLPALLSQRVRRSLIATP